MNSLITKLHKSLIIAATLLLTSIVASAFDFTKIARANYGNVYRVVAFNEDNIPESIGTGFYISPNVLALVAGVIAHAGSISAALASETYRGAYNGVMDAKGNQ